MGFDVASITLRRGNCPAGKCGLHCHCWWEGWPCCQCGWKTAEEEQAEVEDAKFLEKLRDLARRVEASKTERSFTIDFIAHFVYIVCVDSGVFDTRKGGKTMAKPTKKIVIIQKLHEGIYKRHGGGERREIRAYKTGPRNLLAAAEFLTQARQAARESFGNIGGGSTWMEINGERIDDLELMFFDAPQKEAAELLGRREAMGGLSAAGGSEPDAADIPRRQSSL